MQWLLRDMLRALLALLAAVVALLGLPPAAASSGPVAAGGAFVCALFDGGVVKCWGGNYKGQLGNGSPGEVGDAAGAMGDDLQPVLLGAGAVAVRIAAGFAHACAVLSTGEVKCWGDNQDGQLGLGDTTDRGLDGDLMGDSLPVVDLGTDYQVAEIGCGNFHNCAILVDGRLKCWGLNSLGQLGLDDSNNRGDGTPTGPMGDGLPFVKVQGTDLIAVTIALGGLHTCAIALSGELFCWGDGVFGQLGTPGVASIGDLAGSMEALQPVDLGTGRSAIGMSMGVEHTCVLLNVGDIACFGLNDDGQLGIGSNDNIGDQSGEMGDNLQTVALGAGRSAAQVAAGYYHTCAVLDDGDVKCWGLSDSGQLGIGANDNRGEGPNEMGDNLTAVDLGTGRTAVWLELGDYHTCALLDDGSMKCWGL